MSAPHRTVLLVDDERMILTALERSLRAEGYRVLCADSPAEALAFLAAGGVDVILSDIDMPQMSGVELLSRVKQAFPEVVRMLLTGGATLSTALEAINTGEVYRYLTKPWDNVALRATLREAFARLEELRRAAASSRQAEQRVRLLAELEREHPGIGTVELKDEAYSLDEARLDRLAAGLDGPGLRAFFARR